MYLVGLYTTESVSPNMCGSEHTQMYQIQSAFTAKNITQTYKLVAVFERIQYTILCWVTDDRVDCERLFSATPSDPHFSRVPQHSRY